VSTSSVNFGYFALRNTNKSFFNNKSFSAFAASAGQVLRVGN